MAKRLFLFFHTRKRNQPSHDIDKKTYIAIYQCDHIGLTHAGIITNNDNNDDHATIKNRKFLYIAKLKQLKRTFTGLIGDEQSIQRMKSERTL